MTRARGSYEGLTFKQAELLSFLRFERDADRSPSFDEMQAAIGTPSKSSVYRLVEALVERGYADRIRGRARSIRVYDVPSTPKPASRTTEINLSAVSITALLSEIARRTSGQVRI